MSLKSAKTFGSKPLKLRPAAPPSARAPAKDVAEAEEVAQDVAEIGELFGIEAGRRPRRALQAGVSKAVVICAFLRIAQNRVGFGSFFELFFRFFVPRIPIGVILERKFAVSALDFLVGGIARNSEHFVVVPFSVQV